MWWVGEEGVAQRKVGGAGGGLWVKLVLLVVAEGKSESSIFGLFNAPVELD